MSGIRSGLVACALALTLGAGSAQAFTISESTDFPGSVDFVGGTNLGTLDVGTNTVSGSMVGSCEDDFTGGIVCGPDLQDSFLVDVGVGTQLDSLILSTLVSFGPEGFIVDFEFDDEGGSLGIQEGTPPEGFSSPNLALAPIGPGTYAVSLIIGTDVFDFGDYEYSYDVEFIVSSTSTTMDMPEPLTLGLFAVGLAGLGAARRRSSKSKA